MSYFFLLLVVLLQLFLAACVFYLALSIGDFACVVACTLLYLLLVLQSVEVFDCFLAVDPLLLLDSYLGVCLTFGSFPSLLCLRGRVT